MASPIDPTGAFGLLSDRDRRRILDWFEIRPVWSTDALATKLALESGESSGDAARAQPPGGKRINAKRLELIHNHLPRLVDHDVVEWDRRSGDVVRSDRYDEVVHYLGPLTERDGDQPVPSSDLLRS